MPHVASRRAPDRGPPYADRRDAGRHLVALAATVVPADLLVLGLPRGGVVVADELAGGLGAPLDALIVRKVVHPRRPELALGAVTERDVTVNAPLLRGLGVSRAEFDALAADQRVEVRRRERLLRPDRPALDLSDRAVLLVDDGLATGATAGAAIRHVRSHGPFWLGLAVPVAAADAVDELPALDALICPLRPADFRAVSRYYRVFDQTPDAEVIAVLAGR